MASWPALPSPNQNDYQETLTGGFILSEMDTGPPKVRRRSTSKWIKVACSYNLTGSQLADFRTFYEGDGNFGADQIEDWPRPPGLTEYPAIWLAAPETANLGHDLWKLKVELMVNLGG